ncbi:MAG: hypothetical protein WCT40_04815 [Candidatus Magasanikbacteria bacterium]
MNGFTKTAILSFHPDIQRVWIRAVRECMAPEAGMSRQVFMQIINWGRTPQWLEALENDRVPNIPQKFLEEIFASCRVPDKDVRAAMCSHLIKLLLNKKESAE